MFCIKLLGTLPHYTTAQYTDWLSAYHSYHTSHVSTNITYREKTQKFVFLCPFEKLPQYVGGTLFVLVYVNIIIHHYSSFYHHDLHYREQSILTIISHCTFTIQYVGSMSSRFNKKNKKLEIEHYFIQFQETHLWLEYLLHCFFVARTAKVILNRASMMKKCVLCESQPADEPCIYTHLHIFFLIRAPSLTVTPTPLVTSVSLRYWGTLSLPHPALSFA